MISAAVGTKTKGASVPAVRYSKDGSCSISHMEYIGDVETAVPNAEYTFQCNPQNGTTFTWLSALATRFEMYRFKRLKFTYKPSCSTATTGFVVLGFDFDSYDSFPTKVSVLAWKYSAKSALWQECSLDTSNDARMSTFRYCNYDSTSGDKRLDFLGNLFVLANGPSSLVSGELYVSYECEFRQPAYKIPPALAFYAQQDFMPNLGDYFSALSQLSGNVSVTFPNAYTMIINTAGQYLLSSVVGGSGILGFTDIVFSAENSSSKFIDSNRSATSDPGQTESSYYLNVNVPPVRATFSPLVAGTGLASSILMSTFFK